MLLVHLVWATARRRPILEPAFDSTLLGIVTGRAQELGCSVVVAGCAADHLHAVVRVVPRVALADLVQRLKGGSAYDANRHALCPRPVYWQEGYWAESVSPGDLTPLLRYVRGQRQHHDNSHPAERWQFSAE